jgi:hypothetical protein
MGLLKGPLKNFLGLGILKDYLGRLTKQPKGLLKDYFKII